MSAQSSVRYEIRSQIGGVTLAVGTKLGRYEIRSQIGAGGMGEVSSARDEKITTSE